MPGFPPRLFLVAHFVLRPYFLSLSPASWRQTLNVILGFDYQNDAVQAPQRPLESVNAYLDYLCSNASQRLQAMRNYAQGARCRRSLLLEYFGEATPGFCGKCDVCCPPSPLYRPNCWQRLWEKAQFLTEAFSFTAAPHAQ